MACYTKEGLQLFPTWEQNPILTGLLVVLQQSLK